MLNKEEVLEYMLECFFKQCDKYEKNEMNFQRMCEEQFYFEGQLSSLLLIGAITSEERTIYREKANDRQYKAEDIRNGN